MREGEDAFATAGDIPITSVSGVMGTPALADILGGFPARRALYSRGLIFKGEAYGQG
jgi:hypothetical protein